MKFPSWSTSSISYISGSPTCTGTVNLAISSCVFSDHTLTIFGPVSSDSTAVLTRTFTVTGGRNPYNGVAKANIFLYTADNLGGYIDQSPGMSLQVTTPATFNSGDVTINNIFTIVGEETTLQLFILLNLPLDASC